MGVLLPFVARDSRCCAEGEGSPPAATRSSPQPVPLTWERPRPLVQFRRPQPKARAWRRALPLALRAVLVAGAASLMLLAGAVVYALDERVQLLVQRAERAPQHLAVSLGARELELPRHVRAGQLEPAPFHQNLCQRKARSAFLGRIRRRILDGRPGAAHPAPSRRRRRQQSSSGGTSRTASQATATALWRTVSQSSVRPMSMNSGHGNLK